MLPVRSRRSWTVRSSACRWRHRSSSQPYAGSSERERGDSQTGLWACSQLEQQAGKESFRLRGGESETKGSSVGVHNCPQPPRIIPRIPDHEDEGLSRREMLSETTAQEGEGGILERVNIKAAWEVSLCFFSNLSY